MTDPRSLRVEPADVGLAIDAGGAAGVEIDLFGNLAHGVRRKREIEEEIGRRQVEPGAEQPFQPEFRDFPAEREFRSRPAAEEVVGDQRGGAAAVAESETDAPAGHRRYP